MMPKPGWGIKPLTTTRIPVSRIVLAVTSRLGGDQKGYVETWRLGSLRAEPARRWGVAKLGNYQPPTPELLWDMVTSHCGTVGQTFLFVHDLQRVARLANMLTHLPARGWRLDALSLNPGAPWMVFRRRGATLKVVDVMSIWPTTIEKTGQYFGLSQREQPGDDAPHLAWVKQANMDLAILTTAVDAYLAWIEREQLGSLSVTGNGQAWSAFRRRFMPYGILVHHEEELIDMERRAMWTGRCEAFWHGSLLRQSVDEWDFSNAHNSIARTHKVPVFPHAPIDPAKPLADYLADDTYHVLAEVEVETDVPCVPTMDGPHIVWPVGVFRTTLWSPELRIALEFCRNVRVLRGQQYRAAPALQDWAEWVAFQLQAPDDDVPAWCKDLVKRWGNTLIGRFAMRYPQWEKIGTATVSDVFCTPCVDYQSGDEYMLMQVGFELWQQAGMVAPNNSAPMITGYVMSAMRAKLWHLMQGMPADALLYVDTDSLLVTDRWRSWMETLAKSEAGQGLRLKRTWEGMNIYGPRQIVTGDAVRIAGLPKTAQRVSRHAWEGETVESLQQAMAGRSADAVRITPRQWEIEGVDTRRVGPAVGWTVPYVVGQPGWDLRHAPSRSLVAGQQHFGLRDAGDRLPDDSAVTR